MGTVKSWRRRARLRAEAERARVQAAAPATVAPVSAAERDAAYNAAVAAKFERIREAQRRAAAESPPPRCVRCYDQGQVIIPAVRDEGGLILRRSRIIPCPQCGGRRVARIAVLPRDEYANALRRTGDLLGAPTFCHSCWRVHPIDEHS